ncbi:MAG: c-type cytochrome [Sphingobacteriales bacterium]|nr:c-type cytochrome [Sphingobacteriales bacterium]
MKINLEDNDESVINLSRSILVISTLFILVVGVFATVLFFRNTNFNFSPNQVSKSASKTGKVKNRVLANLWKAPSESTIPKGTKGEEILYGKELIVHTSKYLGPKGSVMAISNGMNCQNCHNDAGKKSFGLNLSAVASTYPQFKARSNTMVSISGRINGCFQRSLNGTKLDTTSKEMKAMVAYIKWLGQDVKKGVKPKNSGVEKLAFLDRAADPIKGKAVYLNNCVSCHGKNGEGLLAASGKEYTYPPLWGNNSYNDGAGLYRLSNFAGFVKNNMPFGINYENPLLTDEESWDVAAFVNSQPRPHKDQSKDWKQIDKKPFDFPFGPYADKFSEKQHKYGPFAPISESKKLKSNKKA